jgi:hypothetical protein
MKTAKVEKKLDGATPAPAAAPAGGSAPAPAAEGEKKQ